MGLSIYVYGYPSEPERWNAIADYKLFDTIQSGHGTPIPERVVKAAGPNIDGAISIEDAIVTKKDRGSHMRIIDLGALPKNVTRIVVEESW